MTANQPSGTSVSSPRRTDAITTRRPPETVASITWGFARLGAWMLCWLALYFVMLAALVNWRDPHAALFGRMVFWGSALAIPIGLTLTLMASRSAAPRLLRVLGGICLLAPLACVPAACTAVLLQL